MNYKLTAIKRALSQISTNHWDWDRIDCCLTGKDADIEPWGDQGVEVTHADDEGVEYTAHILKTFTGNEVCLNLPPEIEENDQAYDDAREAYLQEAEAVVQGCDVPGEWDGDSWVFADAVPGKVRWIRVESGEIDYTETARVIVEAATAALEPAERELVLCDEILNNLAGWTEGVDSETGEPIRCEPCKPGRYAAWRQE